MQYESRASNLEDSLSRVSGSRSKLVAEDYNSDFRQGFQL